VSVDFAAVQWARRMAAALDPLRTLAAEDLARLLPLIQAMAGLPDAGWSDQQLNVILQNMHSKRLSRVEKDKGGLLVEFTGGGFEYERFLVRADGRVPNSRYQAERVKRDE
jgi:hypothetical protein